MNKVKNNQETANNDNEVLAEDFIPKLPKKIFRQWILGMLMGNLNVGLEDIEKLKILKKCSEEIIQFGDENKVFSQNFR